MAAKATRGKRIRRGAGAPPTIDTQTDTYERAIAAVRAA
jgi:hypothetical protein